MAYSVKELYLTLQGEGAHAGRAAVFCRFAGCNLWSGRESDRASAVCQFCDTDFVGTDGDHGGKFDSAEDLADMVAALWTGRGRPYVVCTGGEPLLQLDAKLVSAFHRHGVEVAVETNGTLPIPEDIDWVCVSPKGSAELVVHSGDELKLVYPQKNAPPERYASLSFTHFFLQPMDGPQLRNNEEQAVEYCRRHPQWRLSLQMHKILGLR
jgi:7-carboxy-7-deazaguanine synthase (Cx14CxxC type)